VVNENGARVALPGSGSLADAELATAMGAWLRSAPLRELAEISGWTWPATASDRALGHVLADLSADWDFRARAATAMGTTFVERSAMPVDEPLKLDGRVVDPEQVVSAVRALGFVESEPEPEFEPTHVVVLSGTARANVNRSRLAAAVVAGARTLPSVVVGLTAHRELKAPERESCAGLGLRPTDTEWTTLRDALVGALGLPAGPSVVEESRPDTGSRAERFGRSAALSWTDGPVPVELLVVPSPSAATEDPRPAKTDDQLRHWTATAGLDATSAVLLVTTQIYVPYQQVAAVRVLREAAPGCRLATTGVDLKTATVPTRPFTAQDYLQEVRSTLLAARGLLDDLAAA